MSSTSAVALFFVTADAEYSAEFGLAFSQGLPAQMFEGASEGFLNRRPQVRILSGIPFYENAPENSAFCSADLAEVVRQWPLLPEAIRVAILAMVKAMAMGPHASDSLDPQA